MDAKRDGSSARKPEPNPADLATLTEAEWLVAELLVLQREAIARAASLDATLTYVSERCAAVGRR